MSLISQPQSPISPINLERQYVGSPVSADSTASFRRTIRPVVLNRIFSELDIANEASSMDQVLLIRSYQNQICDHLDKRISIFYKQLVTCFGTQLQFDLGQTREQGDTGRPLFIRTEKSWEKICSRHAAHSSTLPCLVASEKPVEFDQENIQENHAPITLPSKFIFMQESDMYVGANATMELPSYVNQADIVIDGSKSCAKLREDALTLINQTADSLINPKEALHIFVDRLETHIVNGLQNPKLQPGVKTSLEIYQEQVAIVKDRMRGPRFFDDLLSIDVPDDDGSEAIERETIHRIRYRAIRRNQLVQASVAKKIRTLKSKLKNIFVDSCLHYRDAVFQELLLEAMPNENDVLRLKKFWNYTPLDVSQFKKGQLTNLKRTRRIYEMNKHLFVETAQALSKYMSECRANEDKSRRRIISKLTKQLELSKEQISMRISRLALDPSVSASVHSVFEDDSIQVNEELVTMISSVLKAPQILLAPNFFYA